jgi:hypothetical protein
MCETETDFWLVWGSFTPYPDNEPGDLSLVTLIVDLPVVQFPN